MKTLFKFSAYFFAAAILLSSCKKDNEDDTTNTPTEGQITIGTKTYTFSQQGILDNYGSDDGTFPSFQYDGINLDVFLIENKMSFVFNPQGVVTDLTGTGVSFYFESFSSDSLTLGPDTFRYHASSPYPIGTFATAEYCLNTSSAGSTDCHTIEEGYYIVNLTGDTYLITLNLTDVDGTKITGSFKGKLRMQF